MGAEKAKSASAPGGGGGATTSRASGADAVAVGPRAWRRTGLGPTASGPVWVRVAWTRLGSVPFTPALVGLRDSPA